MSTSARKQHRLSGVIKLQLSGACHHDWWELLRVLWLGGRYGAWLPLPYEVESGEILMLRAA